MDIELNNVLRVLDEYQLKFQEFIKRKIILNDKKASGSLLASIHTSIEIDGERYTVYLHSEDYLKYIESGTKAHWPPSKPILQWVKDKKLPTSESTGDKSLPTEKQLTFLISRAMAGLSPNQARLKNPNGGTQPTPLIAETEEELNEIYLAKLEEALMEDIQNSLSIINIQIRFE